MPYHSPSDLRVGDQDVQLKYGSTQYCKTIDRPKYDGMQKVVPKEHSDPSKGWSDHIEVDGASRKPLSQKDAKSLVKNPDKAVDRLLPSDSVLESSVKTGLKAGAFGGGSGAFGGAVATAWARGNGEEIAKQALSGGFEGAVTSGLSSAAADGIANSTGDVSGTVGTILNVGRLRALGEDRLKTMVVSLKQQIGDLEVGLKTAKKTNEASLDDLHKSLEKTKGEFPAIQPVRSEDEKKLDANIAKTEALIGNVYGFTLAHAKVAEKARDELEQLAAVLGRCSCSQKQNLAFLQLEGVTHRAPFHLSEDEIAAMVQDLNTGLLSSGTQVQGDSVARQGLEDDTAVEDLVRQVEELERKVDDLEEARSAADRGFREAQARLVEKTRTSSKELFAAKMKAARAEEDAAKRARALVRQQEYASAMLEEQEARLKRVKDQIGNYAVRIRKAAALIEECSCLQKGQELKIWEPPEVTSTTTTTTVMKAKDEDKDGKADDKDDAKDEGKDDGKPEDSDEGSGSASDTNSAFATTMYNSWDADMENGKLGDADIKLYEADASSPGSVKKECLFTAGSHTRERADVNKMWCYPGAYWGVSEKESSDDPLGKGAVHDLSLLPPSDDLGQQSIVFRFRVPRAGRYTLDLFGAKRFRGGKGFVNAAVYANDVEKVMLKHVSDATLPTTDNGENKVYPLGSLEEGDSIFFACNNAGDGVDDDDTRIRFRIQAVVQGGCKLGESARAMYGLSVSSRAILLAMETKVKKLAELNSLRDRHADQVLAENPNSVSRVSVTMDKNDVPAILIGIDASSDRSSVILPDELRDVNVIFETVARNTAGGRA
ncbi:unnamed protein product [Symbiodinium sp. KB8]|nr:unnamed protein product [Symbiodinium sp. KB8]